MCIINAFKEGLESIGKVESFEHIISTLRTELSKKDVYQGFCNDDVNLVTEFDEYLKSPLQNYDKDSADIFLHALGNAYKISIIIFQSNATRCWIVDQRDNTNQFEKTLYFART